MDHAHRAAAKRQEQEPATTEVDRGRARRPAAAAADRSCPGLGHVNCYVLEDERGVAVVDPGLPGPESWKALRRPARAAPGSKLEATCTPSSSPTPTPTTSVAPGRLPGQPGADVVTHRSVPHLVRPGRRSSVEDGRPQPHDAARSRRAHAVDGRPTPWGGSAPAPAAADAAQATSVAPAMSGGSTTPEPTRARRRRRDRSRSAGRDWVALHTPGPHRRPPLPVRPRRGHAALRRPRAAHDHAAHLRARRRTPTR